MNNKWLEWASELQSIAQAGLTFSADRYDLDRYEQIRGIVVEILHIQILTIKKSGNYSPLKQVTRRPKSTSVLQYSLMIRYLW